MDPESDSWTVISIPAFSECLNLVKITVLACFLIYKMELIIVDK